MHKVKWKKKKKNNKIEKKTKRKVLGIYWIFNFQEKLMLYYLKPLFFRRRRRILK
jgi:hypothetical protein